MIRKCPQCGAANRIPPRHLADTGRCGACKATLPPQNEPMDVGLGDFDAIVQQARVPVLVDFWASWCGPCKMAAPEVHEAAKNLAGQALVLKVNTEQWPQLAARYAVRSIPNFAVFRDGQLIAQQAGLMSSAQLQRWALTPG